MYARMLEAPRYKTSTLQATTFKDISGHVHIQGHFNRLTGAPDRRIHIREQERPRIRHRRTDTQIEALANTH